MSERNLLDNPCQIAFSNPNEGRELFACNIGRDIAVKERPTTCENIYQPGLDLVACHLGVQTRNDEVRAYQQDQLEGLIAPALLGVLVLTAAVASMRRGSRVRGWKQTKEGGWTQTD